MDRACFPAGSTRFLVWLRRSAIFQIENKRRPAPLSVHRRFGFGFLSFPMHLDLRLPLPLLRSQIEAALASVADAVRAGILVKPQGDIQLSGQNGRLVSLVPVRITATGNLVGIGPRVMRGLRAPTLLTFDLAVEFRTRLQVQPDWQLKAESQIAYRWTRDPATGLGLKLPLKEVVKPMLERELQKIGKQVDTWVPELTGLQHRIQEAWRELQRPLPLDEPLILRLRPRKEPIPVSEIRVEGQALRVDVQLPLGGSVGPAEEAVSPGLVPLGDPVPYVDQSESKLILQVNLPWSQLETDMSGLTIEEHAMGRTLQLSWGQMSLQGQGPTFSLQTRFRIKGLPFMKKRILSGQAHLDWRWGLIEGSQELAIEDLEVRLREVPTWLQSSWPVLRPLFKHMMSNAVRQAVAKQIQQTRQEVEDMVADFPLPTGGRLQGRIRQLEILDLDSHDQGLHAKIRLSGEARVVITEI
jgi:hypothetical protein